MRQIPIRKRTSEPVLFKKRQYFPDLRERRAWSISSSISDRVNFLSVIVYLVMISKILGQYKLLKHVAEGRAIEWLILGGGGFDEEGEGLPGVAGVVVQGPIQNC
jgi:hypothetical protein